MSVEVSLWPIIATLAAQGAPAAETGRERKTTQAYAQPQRTAESVQTGGAPAPAEARGAGGADSSRVNAIDAWETGGADEPREQAAAG